MAMLIEKAKGLCVRALSLGYCVIMKLLHPSAFSFYMEQILSPSVRFQIRDKGRIVLGRRIGMRSGCVVSASEAGEVVLGDGCFFNKDCMLVAHDRVEVGPHTKFGPGVMIFDHDYDFKNSEPEKRSQYVKEPIKIGKNVWVGAGTIILRGSHIEDDCVIGAGCVIKGHYNKGTLVIQKRNEQIVPVEFTVN